MIELLEQFADGKEEVNAALNTLPSANTDNVLTNVMNVILYAAGVVAVVMVIMSAIQITTSAGDASKVSKAKKTLIGSVIGIIVVVLAYAIVNFVIGVI